jgi:hypothetical protein
LFEKVGRGPVEAYTTLSFHFFDSQSLWPSCASSDCSPPAQNDIVCENSKTGTASSTWDIPGGGAGDPTIQGFATDISVNRGQIVSFKINTNAPAYTIDLYRVGYYGGMGARKIASIAPSAQLPQTHPIGADGVGMASKCVQNRMEIP